MRTPGATTHPRRCFASLKRICTLSFAAALLTLSTAMLTGCAIEIPLDAPKAAPPAQPPPVPSKHTGGSNFAATLLVLVAIMLSGCAVGPDYQMPLLATPAQWSGAEATKPSRPPELANWWTRLRDPLLAQLVEEAIDGNLDVATAKARIREARAGYRQAVGGLFPAITNSESVRHSKGASSQSQAATSSSATSNASPSFLYQAGFDASWELDLFGANRRSVEAAAYGVDAADENLRSVLLILVGDVASNYVQARGYQARIALARRTALSQDETTQITRNRLAAGTASAADVANATGQAATTRAAIPTLEISYAEAAHRLSILTGRPPAALDDRLEKARPIPAPKLPIPTGVPADILLARPDLRLAERQYAQHTARIGQAEAALYPGVSLTGNIATAGTKLGDLGKNSSISWSFGPTVSVPIFNGGKLRAAVEVAQAQRDQYFLAYRSSVLAALREVEDALVSLGKERARSRTLAASATAYRQAVSLSQSLYKAGSSSFLDVLTAERSLYGAEDALLQSRVLIATDFIALNKALGGGWDGYIDASKPEVVDANTGPHMVRANELIRTPRQP